MITRRRKRTEEEVGFQLAPMIDMTFLLLIFFMLTSTITNQKVKKDIAVPVAPSAVVPDSAANRFIVNIDAAGEFFLGEVRVAEEALVAELRKRFRNNPPLKLYVRADKGVEAARIKKVMRLATEAGAIKVILATTRK